MIKAFCKYSINGKSIKGVSNPFIKNLYLNIFSQLDSVKDYEIQALVKELKNDNAIIDVTDFGAGSRTTFSNERSIKSIAKNASISPKFGKLLNQLVSYYNCDSILELGTSLGIGTSYLALNNAHANIYTLEGCPNISEKAKSNLRLFNNVFQFTGEFSTQFEEVLAQTGKLDLVYIDGNHTKKATLEYFNYFLAKINKKAILVFDDIHWSEGMEEAWTEIVTSPVSRITIDIFRMGLVFLDPELEKEHFVLKF